jgi:hypothetical protein
MAVQMVLPAGSPPGLVAADLSATSPGSGKKPVVRRAGIDRWAAFVLSGDWR